MVCWYEVRQHPQLPEITLKRPPGGPQWSGHEGNLQRVLNRKKVVSQKVIGICQDAYDLLSLHASIGQPGGFNGELCTLGRIYITGVEGCSLVKNLHSDCEMKPSVKESRRKMSISHLNDRVGPWLSLV